MDTTERLITLRNALSVWQPGNYGVAEFDLRTWKYRIGCGTAACAVGLAASIPSLRQEGLTCSEDILSFPNFNGKIQWAAVEDFFGLRYDEAFYCFSHTSYPERMATTPQMVVVRIDEILAKRMSPTEKPAVVELV